MNKPTMDALLMSGVGDTYTGMVHRFMSVMGQLATPPSQLTQQQWEDLVDFRKRLIEEEITKELLPAMDRLKFSQSLENQAEVLDGICDGVYVLLGAALAFRLPAHAGFLEVQRSNMAKLQPDGSVLRREDGKVLKPEGWTPPDLLGVLMYYHEHLGEHQYRNGLRHHGPVDGK